MKKRGVKNIKVKGSRPGRPCHERRRKKRTVNRGPKTEIQRLQSPALVQLLIRAAADYNVKPQRKTERLVTQTARQLLIRLGQNRKEAGILTEKIMEQMQ